MKKTFYYITLFIISFVLIQCSSAEQENKTEVIATKDSITAKDSISKTSVSTQSEITCPKCNYKKVETLPTEFCLLKYTCDSCKIILHPKKGDCCVFCSYGTHKCPSMQEE